MNSQKRKIILNGICIIFVVSLPLTLGMFRIQNVHGDVDYWQGLAIIIITAIIVAVIQTSVSMWLMTGALRIIGWNDTLPYSKMVIIAVVVLILLVTATWFLNRKKI